MRRAPHGARGLKFPRDTRLGAVCGRAPHGARGLKCHARCSGLEGVGSRPAWGAWIEIRRAGACKGEGAGRAPHGARGLKFAHEDVVVGLVGRRAPHGARGLKSLLDEAIR